MSLPVPGLILAAMIAASAVALLCWWFVVRYSRVDWQRTAEGRHVMRLTLVIAVTFTAVVVFYFVPDIPVMAQAVASLLLYGGIAAEMWVRVTLLHDAQRERADRTEE